MRTLSSTLTTAQRSSASQPHPKLEIIDRVGGITRLSWTRLYTGSEVDNFHAAAMPSDGSLIRLRVDASNNLYRQRVTSPGPTSDFSQWTSWGVTAHAVALCARNAEVLAFRVGTDGYIYRCESSDYGATWGSWTQMDLLTYTPGGPWYHRIAACFKSNGDALLLFTNGLITSMELRRRRRLSGSWEASAAWTNSMPMITGVTVAHAGDWNIVLGGENGAVGKTYLSQCLLGDGYSASPGTWTDLDPILVSDGLELDYSYAEVLYTFPCLAYPDVARLFFVEKYSEQETYHRPYWTHSLATAEFISNLWREPVPFNLSSDYGLALCSKSPYVWLTRPDAVWRAPLIPASVELTSDVLLLNTDIKEASGDIVVYLRNDDGRYNSLPEPVKLGSELRFSPGYRATAGIEVSSGLAFWITGWEYLSNGPALVPLSHHEVSLSKGPKSAFVLKAADGWALLDQWKARRQFSWASGSKSVFQILNFIFSRAGLEFSAFSNSSTLVNHYPAFTIHPGESGKTAVLRLLAMVPDVVYFRGNYAYNINPQSSDSSVCSYGSGTTPHQVFEGRYITRNKETNRVQVFGSSVFTEDWDWGEIDLVSDLLTQAKDINLTTTTKGHERGAAELRDAAIHAVDGFILVPLNCGQELYDVVEITDALAGLTAAKRRVLSLSHIYHPTKAQYVVKIGLGSP